MKTKYAVLLSIFILTSCSQLNQFLRESMAEPNPGGHVETPFANDDHIQNIDFDITGEGLYDVVMFATDPNGESIELQYYDGDRDAVLAGKALSIRWNKELEPLPDGDWKIKVSILDSQKRFASSKETTPIIDDQLYDVPPTQRHDFRVEYPIAARAIGISKSFHLYVLVGRHGLAMDVKTAGDLGDDQYGFAEQAIYAAYWTKYFPAMRNGKPVKAWGKFPVTFELLKYMD